MFTLLALYTFSLPITVNFPVGSVQNTVITYLDVRAECEIELLLYGGGASCDSPTHLREIFKDVILRKIVTLTTYDLKLMLVEYSQVKKLFDTLKKEKGRQLQNFMSRFNLGPEKVKYMLWERLNTIRYLKLRFGMKFNKNDPIFKTWYSSKLEKYHVKDIWDKTFVKVFNIRTKQ